jgi:hypothetical protein
MFKGEQMAALRIDCNGSSPGFLQGRIHLRHHGPSCVRNGLDFGKATKNCTQIVTPWNPLESV